MSAADTVVTLWWSAEKKEEGDNDNTKGNLWTLHCSALAEQENCGHCRQKSQKNVVMADKVDCGHCRKGRLWSLQNRQKKKVADQADRKQIGKSVVMADKVNCGHPIKVKLWSLQKRKSVVVADQVSA